MRKTRYPHAFALAVLLYYLCAYGLPLGALEHESFLQIMKRADAEYNAAHFIDAKRLYEEALAEGKVSQVNKPDLAVVLSNIAMIEKLNFHYEEAQDCLEDALPLAGDDEALLALLHTRLTSVFRARGNLSSALDHAKSSVEIRTKIDPKSPELAESLNNVAVLLLEKKNSQEAINYCDRALVLLKENGKVGSAEEAVVMSTKAAAFTEDGKYDGARDLLNQVLANQEKVFGLNSPKLTGTLNNLATTYCKKDQYKEAEPYLKRALQLTESSEPQDIPGAADTSAFLADLYSRMGDRLRADLNFKKAIKYSQAINYRRLPAIKDQYQSFLANEKVSNFGTNSGAGSTPPVQMIPGAGSTPPVQINPTTVGRTPQTSPAAAERTPPAETNPAFQQIPAGEKSPGK